VKLLDENKEYNTKGKLLVFLTFVGLSGLPWWLTNYQVYSNNIIISIGSIIILAILAAYFRFKTNHNFWEIVFVALSAHQVALILKFVKDSFEDPTNNNLAPFEMLFILFIDFITCLIFISVGNYLVRKKY